MMRQMLWQLRYVRLIVTTRQIVNRQQENFRFKIDDLRFNLSEYLYQILNLKSSILNF